MKLLEGKKALILGIANDTSIAWGITKALKEHGAQVGLSYLNEKLKTRVQPLADEVGADFTFELDVTNNDHYDDMRKEVIEKWKNVDIVVHSLAFANRDDLRRDFSETSREGFALACDVVASQ